MKKIMVSNEEALDAISRCKTQAEALELLKDRFGDNAAFDVNFWFAFYDLPTEEEFFTFVEAENAIKKYASLKKGVKKK